jgi:hypothetical protein
MTAAASPRSSPSTSCGYSRLIGEDEAVTARAVREHCEAQDVPDTLVLRCLAETHS